MIPTPDNVVLKLTASPSRIVLFFFLLTCSMYAIFWYWNTYHPLPKIDRPLARASPSEAVKIKQEIAVVILTSSPTIKDRLQNLMDSWVPHWQENTYWFSDNDVKEVENFPTGLKPNWIVTGCDSTYTTGLICKNKKMVTLFRTEPFKHYQWVVRLMDDTWLDMENLAELLSHYAPTTPMLIGERFCHPSFQYPTGGPGFVISRGLINSFDLTAWAQITSDKHRKEALYDDLAWGQLLQHMKIPLTHHHGFSQHSASLGNSLFNYMLRREEWDLPFRPIAYHQGPSKCDLMPHLEDVMHRLPYNVTSPRMVQDPECTCWPMQSDDHEVRCTPTQRLSDRGKCGNGLRSINCLTGR